jgi:hypothetical protein
MFFLRLLDQQSEYKVFYKLVCWLGLVCRLSSVMRSHPARRSRSPCYRSAGHRLCNLRMTSSLGRCWSGGFGCEASFVRCLILLSWMTACTVGILRSLWIISLVTYHGASTTEHVMCDNSIPVDWLRFVGDLPCAFVECSLIVKTVSVF